LNLDIKALIKNHELRFIVLSPMVSFLRGLTGLNEELEVRGILEKLQADIEDTGCTIIGICHTNKKPDLRAIERLLGSVAFTNFVRSVLLVAPDKDEAGWVRLAHAKHNLSVRGDDLLYRAVHAGENPHDQNVALEWKRPENGNAETDAMFDRKKPDANGHDREPTAAKWLVGYLREHGESLRADIMLAGERAGHTEPAIAKAQVRNKSIRTRVDGWQGPSIWWLE
jgi:putative DNA primase/helicase